MLDGRLHLFEFGNLRAQCGDLGTQFVDFGGVAESAQREVGDLTSDFFANLAFKNFGTLPDVLRQFVDDLFELVFGFGELVGAVGLVFACSGGYSVQAVFEALASNLECSSCKEEKFYDRPNHNSNLRIALAKFRGTANNADSAPFEIEVNLAARGRIPPYLAPNLSITRKTKVPDDYTLVLMQWPGQVLSGCSV